MRFVVGAALACAGCLSEPAFPVAPGQPFPPAEALAVRAAGLGDLNGDGAADLLLASDSGPDGRGLFLLFGGAPGWQDRYHGFLPTPEVPPFAVHAQDVDGDRLIDLAVLGPTGVDQAALGVYLGSATGGVTYAPGLVRAVADVQISPSYEHAYIIPVRLDDDADVDLVLGQFRWEATVELDHFDDRFVDVPLATIPRDLADGEITAAAAPLPDPDSGLDGLLIARFGETVHHASPGVIAFPDVGTVMPHDGTAGHARAGFVDVDGDGQLDAVGFGAGRLSALIADPAAPRFARYPDYWEGTPTWFHLDDLDDDGDPEVMVTLAVATGTRLLMFAGVRLDEQLEPPELATTVRPPLELAGFVAAAGAAADFDGDGVVEAMLIAADGAMVCLQLRATGAEPCPEATAAP